MQDRYLYKAKGQTDNKWHIGLLTMLDGEVARITGNEIPGTTWICDSPTLCQCTGLKDKNGKLIWENDIIKFEDDGEEGYEYKEGFEFVNIAKVVWNKGRFELDKFMSDNSGVLDLMHNCPDDFYSMFEYYAEIIGNIFDNPELLEV